MTRCFQSGWRLCAGVAVAIMVASPVMAQQRSSTRNVSGKWSLVIRTDEGPQLRSLDLAVAQDSVVTGIVGSSLGTLPISSGRLAGDRLRFEFAMAGGEIRVSYDVVVRGDTLRGVFRQDAYEGAVLGVRGDRPVQFPPPHG